MAEYKFWLTVEVDEDHPQADDEEWWADAAAGGCEEYGASASYSLEDPTLAIDQVAHGALDQIAEMLRDPDWGVGMLEDIAEIVIKTGRLLDNPTGESTWDRH